MRLDVYLVEKGYFPSRQKANDAIRQGAVSHEGKVITKPSHQVDGDPQFTITAALGYVSRAALKLVYALQEFTIDLNGKLVLDIGSSTGGFTDVCLKNGASRVYAIDVGTAQLDQSLRTDPRVVVRENTNARYLKKGDFPEPIDFICTDVSFISLKLLIPVISELLEEGRSAVLLVKPQFEVGRRFLNKHGVVTDQRQIQRILTEISSLLSDHNLIQSNYIESPLKGREGNTEFLVYIIKR